MKRQIELDNREDRDPFKEYRGEYVTFSIIPTGESIGGKYLGMDKHGYCVLEEFTGARHSVKKSRLLIENDIAKVRVDLIGIIKPTTRKNIENYLEKRNREEQEEKQAKKAAINKSFLNQKP